MRRVPGLAALAGLLLVGACVSGTGAASAGTGDVITREQIDRGQWANAYDLVSNLRPRWVHTRGADSFENPGQVQVYVDGTRLGGVQLLRTLPTTAIQRIEWVDPVSAAGRWGLNHAHGVIHLIYGRDGRWTPAADTAAPDTTSVETGTGAGSGEPHAHPQPRQHP